MLLKDKVALVTGAAQGIGRAIALGFAGAGANIVMNDIKNEDAAKEDLAQIKRMDRKVLYVQGDVSLEEDVEKIVTEAMGKFKRIDILVNNAGLRTIAYLGLESCPVLEMELAHWDRMIAVNLRGPFMMSKAVLPQMIKQKQGSIINISSGAGSQAVPGKSAYSASKHGLEGFTKSLAGEVRPYNIRANTLRPGGRVDIDGRGGLPAEVIIPACNFLASDDSKDISGTSVVATDWNKQNRFETLNTLTAGRLA